ncbi:MAG: ubiquitin-like protein [Solirubrobacteraceae bacterium]
MLPSLRRHDEHATRLVITVDVRDPRGRTVTIELAPNNTVWWATERALISLGDKRRAEECRLVFRGKPLRPRRSLAASGIDHGDTLELVPANAIRSRRTLTPRSLRQALKPKHRKQEHKPQR